MRSVGGVSSRSPLRIAATTAGDETMGPDQNESIKITSASALTGTDCVLQGATLVAGRLAAASALSTPTAVT